MDLFYVGFRIDLLKASIAKTNHGKSWISLSVNKLARKFDATIT